MKDGEFLREEIFDLKIENLTYLEAVKIVTRSKPAPARRHPLRTDESRYDDGRYIDATFRIGFLLPLASMIRRFSFLSRPPPCSLPAARRQAPPRAHPRGQ